METNTTQRVTSVAVTRCGNFGVLGFANGTMTKFNMQSGKERGVFGIDRSGMTLHTAEVTGIAVDSLSRKVISCSKDKTVKLWDFFRCKLIQTYSASEYPIANLTYSFQSDLIAFSSSDLSMTILNP